MLIEAKTGPTPLNPRELAIVRSVVKNGHIPSLGRKHRHFNDMGTFLVKEQRLTNRSSPAACSTLLWSCELMKYNPDLYRIKFSKSGNLRLFNLHKEEVCWISAKEVRIVHRGLSGKVTARESGFVLPDEDYYIKRSGLGFPRSYFFRGVGLSTEELHQILVTATNPLPEEPPDYLELPFVKVSPDVAGKRLKLLVFSQGRDAVVVNPETRQLVEREVTFPLSRARWEGKLSRTLGGNSL